MAITRVRAYPLRERERERGRVGERYITQLEMIDSL